jgi:purine-binding chemotaxis protein CheW
MPELSSGAPVTLGCFEVGSQLYAIDVVQVREVVRWQAPTPLPRAPALIDGVVDLRGAVIPVVDLGIVLRGVATRAGGDARIAIVEVDGLVMGLVVDAAVEVLEVEAAALDDPPALTAQAGYDALRAVVRRPGRDPIMVLSLDHILESIHRSAPPASEVA